MKHSIVITAVIALACGVLSGCANTNAAEPGDGKAQTASKKYRVVFHVTESNPQKWNIVLNNVGNVQHDLGKDNVAIEIVTHGPGIDMLKADSKVGARLAQALDNNVVLAACQNTMRNAKVTKADMYGGISYVRSGVTHIIQRESDGWNYLRP